MKKWLWILLLAVSLLMAGCRKQQQVDESGYRIWYINQDETCLKYENKELQSKNEEGMLREMMEVMRETPEDENLKPVIPEDAASDFNQGLIELGAIVCVPNGEAKCEICPLTGICEAKRLGIQNELPVKKKAKARKIEERTVLIFMDGYNVAIRKRPDKGLLAGMYEFPNLDGKLTMDEVTAYSKSIGLAPVRVKKLRNAKHIFSHIEWHMTAYEVIVDELEKNCKEEMIFAHPEEIQKEYSMPSAFSAWKVK